MLVNILAAIGFAFVTLSVLSYLNLFNTIYYVGVEDKVLITKAEYERLLANQKEEE